MPLAKPRVFCWFFGIWLAMLAGAILWLNAPRSDLPVIFTPLFWGVALGSILLVIKITWSLLRWWRNPLIFDPGDGAPVRRLRSWRLAAWMVFGLILGLAGTVYTVVALPFSPKAQLIAGLRGRKIELPRGDVRPEDRLLSEICLQPIWPFTREAAAALAAELRAETGLRIAALPEREFDLPLHPQRQQVAAEKIYPQLSQLALKTPAPSLPHPHSLLMIALIEPDMYSENLPWSYQFAACFSKNLSAVSVGHLKIDLPMDDAQAQHLVFLRMKKILLRLIAQMIFEEPHGTDRRSLTGPVWRGLGDIDFSEEHLRGFLQERIQAGYR